MEDLGYDPDAAPGNKARGHKGSSALADKAGLSKSFVSELLSNKKLGALKSIESFARLARALECSVESLLPEFQLETELHEENGTLMRLIAEAIDYRKARGGSTTGEQVKTAMSLAASTGKLTLQDVLSAMNATDTNPTPGLLDELEAEHNQKRGVRRRSR